MAISIRVKKVQEGDHWDSGIITGMNVEVVSDDIVVDTDAEQYESACVYVRINDKGKVEVELGEIPHDLDYDGATLGDLEDYIELLTAAASVTRTMTDAIKSIDPAIIDSFMESVREYDLKQVEIAVERERNLKLLKESMLGTYMNALKDLNYEIER